MAKTLAIALLLVAGNGNLAPDAVTRATRGYNVYEGDLAALTDGRYPETDDDAAVLRWPTKGNLVFQFDQPRAVVALRIRVGADAGTFQVRAYRGAVYTDEGQTDALQATLLADVFDASFTVNDWVELEFPEVVRTDYIELAVDSGADIFEVEILSPEGTTMVGPTSWAAAKQRRGG